MGDDTTTNEPDDNPTSRRERRHLTPDEVAELVRLLEGRRPTVATWAALVAAIATLVSAVGTAVVNVVSALADR